MSHTGSFDIKTPGDFLERMILPQHADFLRNNASSRCALLCIILVYHMYEWANNRTKFEEEAFKVRYPSEAHLAELFALARRLVTGTKHFENRIETDTQTGFSSAFSNAFVRPLYVIKSDGSKLSADDLLNALVDFWKSEQSAGAF